MRKLHGFRVSHRNRWFLIQYKILNFGEFLLYEYYIDVSGHDRRNYSYGLFEYFKEEIAIVFNRSPETINDWHKGLLTKRFILLEDKKRKLYRIKNRFRYEHLAKNHGQTYTLTKLEKIQDFEEILQQQHIFSSEEQENIPEIMRPFASNNTNIAIVPYKEDSNALNSDIEDDDLFDF